MLSALAPLYLLLTLLLAGVLLALLARPGAARGMTVWGLAALLPLLAAVAGALTGQARAARTLSAYTPQPVSVTVVNGAERRTLTLDAGDAACLARAARLHTPGRLQTSAGTLRLTGDTAVEGALPAAAVVEALGLRGELACPPLRPLSPQERAAP